MRSLARLCVAVVSYAVTSRAAQVQISSLVGAAQTQALGPVWVSGLLGAVQLSEEQEFRLANCEDTNYRRCRARDMLISKASNCKTLAIERLRRLRSRPGPGDPCRDSGEVRIRAYCEKGWGGITSSVIGNVRAERDDRGLVDVAGREAFVACV